MKITTSLAVAFACATLAACGSASETENTDANMMMTDNMGATDMNMDMNATDMNMDMNATDMNASDMNMDMNSTGNTMDMNTTNTM